MPELLTHLLPGRANDVTDRPVVVRDPATEEVVARAPVAGADDVTRAVDAARAAAKSWRTTGVGERAEALNHVASLVAERAEELAHVTTLEMGRPVAEARAGVDAGVASIRQYAELGQVRGGRSLLGDWDATDLMVPEPLGVVAVITPWNDPVPVAAAPLAAALMAGNTVVAKPSERTPWTGQLLVEQFARALPEGVVTLLHGDGRTGEALAGAAVDGVFHVGSTRAGRSIAAATARTGAHTVLENGGKDPMLVDETVDPAWAAGQVALGAFANAGQLCTSVERAIVVDEVADELVTALVKEAEAYVVGPGLDPATTMGPLVDDRMRETVHAQVRDAAGTGATVLTGGEPPERPGYFYPPTVLDHCDPGSRLLVDETFGPVAPVVRVADFAEGLELATRGEYGLAATVLSADPARVQQAWRELPVGTVKVNDVFGGAPGGAAHPRGASGHGYGYGPELLDEFRRTKVVHLAIARPRR